MSRVDALLRPDEEVVFRNNPGPVWLGLPLAGLCVAGLGWLGYALYRGEAVAADWVATLVLLPVLVLFFAWYAHRPDIVVTHGQVLRSAGLLRGKAEVIAREDIAEIRFQGWRTGILTRAPGQLRMTLPNGMAIVDGRVWFPVPGLGWWRRRKDAGRSERQAFAIALGLTPMRWRPPSLPEKAALLDAVDFLAGMAAVILWAAACWAALSFWADRTGATEPLRDPVFWTFGPAIFVSLWLMNAARRYLILMLAPKLAPAAMARLWLCAAYRPDWRGEHRESVTTSRAGRLARYERLLSRRYGEPLGCAGLAGPEACNGGWIK
ncbi:MAG: hypothetical protein IMF08_11305 [Proteobacteria bacterium]|nr:hypothetical protein [Pseudomonadota bacterium]